MATRFQLTSPVIAISYAVDFTCHLIKGIDFEWDSIEKVLEMERSKEEISLHGPVLGGCEPNVHQLQPRYSGPARNLFVNVRSDLPFTQRSGDMVYTSWLD